MESRYIEPLHSSYLKGYQNKYGHLPESERPELKEHYFKVKNDLARVQVVLGFLHGIVPAGLCRSLLDVGSGRGVFLLPLLRDFPQLDVTCIDILPHRVALWECLHSGGLANLHPIRADITRLNEADNSFDVVTMLEVMEHIPDTEAVVRQAVRLARNYIIVSVPSKPDDNPEHIHLFSAADLMHLFDEAGCKSEKFMSVTGHHIMIAAK